MNEKQKLLFQNLMNIKKYGVKTSIGSLNPNTDLIWLDNEDEYKLLQTKLKSSEELVVKSSHMATFFIQMNMIHPVSATIKCILIVQYI